MPVVTNSMSRVIVSPHPDDAVLALGACIPAWVRQGVSVHVVTVFDGPPRGELTIAATEDRRRYSSDPVPLRRAEDAEAVSLLGATLESVGMEELVYRYRVDGAPRLQGLDDLYGPLTTDDNSVVDAVASLLAPWATADVTVHVPMAIGGHSDHRVVRVAAERALSEFELYDDMPYAIREGHPGPSVAWPDITEADVELWVSAVKLYRSQMVPLFEAMPDWEPRFRAYARTQLA
jgi:LmbE family N-acetylglucosaminyl deacetylase